MDERELVRRILAGDPQAQDAFYRENAKRLYPVCVHFLGWQDPDAEDVVQETFLIAFKKVGQFRFQSSLYTWLNHICVNLCFERLRKRKRVLASLHEDLERMVAPKARLRDDDRSDEEEKAKRLQLVERIILSMSERCRKVLELRDKKGESYINMARMLKVPPGTVMSQLARCRKGLKQLVEHELKGKKK